MCCIVQHIHLVNYQLHWTTINISACALHLNHISRKKRLKYLLTYNYKPMQINLPPGDFVQITQDKWYRLYWMSPKDGPTIGPNFTHCEENYWLNRDFGY